MPATSFQDATTDSTIKTAVPPSFKLIQDVGDIIDDRDLNASVAKLAAALQTGQEG